jgi:hypothetical protein
MATNYTEWKWEAQLEWSQVYRQEPRRLEKICRQHMFLMELQALLLLKELLFTHTFCSFCVRTRTRARGREKKLCTGCSIITHPKLIILYCRKAIACPNVKGGDVSLILHVVTVIKMAGFVLVTRFPPYVAKHVWHDWGKCSCSELV